MFKLFGGGGRFDTEGLVLGDSAEEQSTIELAQSASGQLSSSRNDGDALLWVWLNWLAGWRLVVRLPSPQSKREFFMSSRDVST